VFLCFLAFVFLCFVVLRILGICASVVVGLGYAAISFGMLFALLIVCLLLWFEFVCVGLCFGSLVLVAVLW